VQQGLSYTLIENTQYNGTTQQGYFTVVVDNGTGSPPGQLLTNVANAVNGVRPLGSTFGVFAPVVVNATVVMTITTATGYVHATVAAAVQSTLQTYINTLGLGNSLFYTRLAQVAYSVPGVTEVLVGYTLNGGSVDLAATALQTIRASTITVS
jgi:phage-related baseplate assembly protein